MSSVVSCTSTLASGASVLWSLAHWLAVVALSLNERTSWMVSSHDESMSLPSLHSSHNGTTSSVSIC
ncbi:hypothetical protein DU504_13540 [Haloplanus salinus]|jgi:hypothetical protein|uniref:Uncharacterized protein n=1 Tax=Haloplanus salinus TaxID=1126245 RepID=A0A368NCL8_9EURY|nr:hypothetical protein DU504_13540 [Haloplanus salinus]